MDATFSDEQVALRHAVREVAEDRCSSAALRAFMASGEPYDADLWSLLAGDLGLVGVAIPEEYAGSGGTLVEAAIICEEAGRALLPVPLVGSIVAAAGLADPAESSSLAAEVVAELAAGNARATVVVSDQLVMQPDRLTGTAGHVLDAAAADWLLVAAAGGLLLVRARDARVRRETALDSTRSQATVTFETTPAERVGSEVEAARAADVLRVMLAHDALGVARRCLEMTVDYLQTRVQFGKPIGSFQALQHRAADLAVTVEAAASAAYYAAWAAADSPAELPIVAPLALSVCADAAYLVAAETIQLHGGIGFTWEHDAHLYFKRASTIRLALGDTHVQRRLVASRAGISAPAS